MRTRRNQNRYRQSANGAARQPVTGHDRRVASTLAGMALFAVSPASHSLSLGDLTVHSSLGQPLDASVPVQLAAGESLTSGCVRAAHSGGSELGRVPDVTVSTPEAARPGLHTLRLSSAAALYEPIYALNLQASCPGTAAIGRQYVLMLDLPGMTTGQASEPSQPPVTQPEQLPKALPASIAAGDALRTPVPSQRPLRPRRTLEATTTPILPGTSYQVVAGDTLSSIAARISGRKVNLWTLADQIFAANPAAFIRNDINLIKLGSTIVIPVTDTAAEAMTAAASPAQMPEVVMLPEPVVIPTVVPAPVVSEPAATTIEVAATRAAEVAPVSRIAPAAEVAAPPAETSSAAAEDGASPVAATAAGIIFGLLVSALLWFRHRMPAITRKRPAQAAAKSSRVVEEVPVGAKKPVPVPIAVRTERAEPSITVQWSARPDDALAAEFTTAAPAEKPQAAAPASAASSEEITSELEKLFGDDSETMNAPAPAMPSISADTGGEKGRTETLLEALSLLERDYESELTASQVLDLSAMREALATGTDSMPTPRKPD